MRAFIQLLLAVVLVASVLATVSLYRREVRFQSVLLEQAAATATRLNSYNQLLERQADANAQHIGYEVHRNQNQARDLAVLRQTEEITQRADSLTSTLSSIIIGLKLTEPVSPAYNFIVPIAGAGTTVNAQNVAQVAKQLARYKIFIQQYVPDTPFLARFASSSGDWFMRDYFRFSYETATVASMTRLITEVRRMELAALFVQARKVGSCCFCFDRIGAVAVPVSSTVAPGSIYQARLFFAESSSGFHYTEMRVNDQKVSAVEAGQGLVEIPIPVQVPAGLPDTTRTQWHGAIRTDLYPADTTWHLTVPFFIINSPSR